jgi:hypothetical protein
VKTAPRGEGAIFRAIPGLILLLTNLSWIGLTLQNGTLMAGGDFEEVIAAYRMCRRPGPVGTGTGIRHGGARGRTGLRCRTAPPNHQ